MARSLQPKLLPEVIELAENPGVLDNPNGSDAIIAWNQLVEEFEQAGAVESYVLQEQLYEAAARVYYEGIDPKDVPAPALLFMVRHETGDKYTPKEGYPNHYKARTRIRGPQQAIRAFCIACQGDNTTAVRECADTCCPFWSFRMGNNPFFGKIPNAEAAADPEEELVDADPPTE